MNSANSAKERVSILVYGKDVELLDEVNSSISSEWQRDKDDRERLLVALAKLRGFLCGNTFSSRYIPQMEKIVNEALAETDKQ